MAAHGREWPTLSEVPGLWTAYEYDWKAMRRTDHLLAALAPVK